MSGYDESIDENKLEELRGILEEDGLQELITDFFELARFDIDKLESAARQEINEDIFRASHGLKSSSGNLGFIKLSEMCRHLESQARNNNVTDANQQTQSILDEFNHLKEILA